MKLKSLNILNYKNIREAEMHFSDNLNLFVGLNGQGKTNVLDAIYMLSFTKSAFTQQDSACITHGEQIAMVQGEYAKETEEELIKVSCGLKIGVKKQFRLGRKDYKRMVDHIGLIPLVLIGPQDQELLTEGSEERRRFLDIVISQQNREYLENLNSYNALLKQRNSLLKQLGEQEQPDMSVLEIYEMQMAPLAEKIYRERKAFITAFSPIFETLYHEISGGCEHVTLSYLSQLDDRDLGEAYLRTRQRDLILGWTSQGIHKDDLIMLLGDYPIRQVGSQGQQKTYVLALKLAQAMYLGKPILLLDDIFDRLDSERVGRIVELVKSERFGQIFITDTDRQHLVDLVCPDETAKIFNVENGCIH